jgi:hypothetical protein
MASEGLHIVAALFSSAAAIGLAVAILGSVISLAAVVAAYHQVEKMEGQNSLITQQVFESKATRVSQLFAAQLPPLLQEIADSRRESKAGPWAVSDELQARLQALIYATQPYMPDGTVAALRRATRPIEAQSDSTRDGDALYSPERGQLLMILVAMRFPFDTLKRPMDFSNVDLRGMALGEGTNLGAVRITSLGRTRLQNANLRTAELGMLDLSGTDLRGAILPPWHAHESSTFFWSLGTNRNAVAYLDRLRGASLDGVIFDTGKTAGRSDSPLPPGVNRHLWVAESISGQAQSERPEGEWKIITRNQAASVVLDNVHRTLVRVGGFRLSAARCKAEGPAMFNEARAGFTLLPESFQRYIVSLLDDHDSSVTECFFDTDSLRVRLQFLRAAPAE